MNKVSKIVYTLLVLFSFSILDSCTYVKKADSAVRKTFGTANRFKRQKSLYTRRLGLNNKKGADNPDGEDQMQRNPIQQKNIINDYGYIFEGLNGFDPGYVVNYNNNDSVSNVFEISNQAFKTIEANREVFGWHPHWMGSSWKKYPFELLSTIAYFSYNVNSRTGLSQNPKQIEDWKTTELIAVAQEKNTRVLLTVSLHGKKNNAHFLSNELLWNNLYEDVGKLVLDRYADGIDINFEDIPDDLKNEFTRFVSNFRKSLGMKFKNNNREAPYISLTLPAHKDRENFNVEKLESEVDLFVIMGYDYNSTSDPDAVSPLQSEGIFSLTNTIAYFKAVNLNLSKTILALPYYGILWDISIKKDESIEAVVERKLTYSEIKKLFLENPDIKAEVDLDPISMSKVYRAAFDDYSIKEIHFDDVFTLSKKYDYAMVNGMRGIGVWALGYDNGSTELWNLIERYFSTDKIKFNDPILEANGFPIRFAKNLVQNKDVFIAMIIYFVMAVILAFVLLLSDWRIRDSIMRSKINQIIVIFIGFTLLIPLIVFIKEILNKAGYYVNSSGEVFLGFFIGLVVFFLATRMKFDRIIEKP